MHLTAAAADRLMCDATWRLIFTDGAEIIGVAPTQPGHHHAHDDRRAPDKPTQRATRGIGPVSDTTRPTEAARRDPAPCLPSPPSL